MNDEHKDLFPDPPTGIIPSQSVGRLLRNSYSSYGTSMIAHIMGVPRSMMNTTPSEEAYNGLKGNFPLGPFQRLEEKWLKKRMKIPHTMPSASLLMK